MIWTSIKIKLSETPLINIYQKYDFKNILIHSLLYSLYLSDHLFSVLLKFVFKLSFYSSLFKTHLEVELHVTFIFHSVPELTPQILTFLLSI